MLRRAWRGGFSLQCDFARRHAGCVGMAASLALITTKIETGRFGRSWHVTVKGLAWINEKEIHR